MPISPLNNCSDQVIDMAQIQQILVDAEFVREQNQRTFAKLNAIQDAALMRSSSQVSAGKGFGCGKAAHNTVSQVLLWAGRKVEEARVGSRYW